MQHARVTVLLPVYNGARYVAGAVASILDQTFGDFELLAIDDGSEDDSVERIRAFSDPRIRIESNGRNLGLTRSLNHGLGIARGELIARQDADDSSSPVRLARQVEFLDRHHEVALVGAQGWLVDENGRCLGELLRSREHDSILWELCFDNAFLHTAAVFRRDVVRGELGGYDESYKSGGEDYDLWSRLARKHRVANLGEHLVVRRARGDSITTSMKGASESVNRRIIPGNAKALLGELSSGEIDTLVSLRAGVRPEAVAQTARVIRKLLAVHERLHPNAADRSDFKRLVARQYVGWAMARTSRTLGRSLRFLAEAFGHYPVAGVLARAVLMRSALLVGFDSAEAG